MCDVVCEYMDRNKWVKKKVRGGREILCDGSKGVQKAVTMDNFKVIKKGCQWTHNIKLLLLWYDSIKLHHYYTLKIVL